MVYTFTLGESASTFGKRSVTCWPIMSTKYGASLSTPLGATTSGSRMALVASPSVM